MTSEILGYVSWDSSAMRRTESTLRETNRQIQRCCEGT
jgi:hypothetical protein